MQPVLLCRFFRRTSLEMNDPMLPLSLSLLSPLPTNVEATSDPERSRFNFLEGPNDLRAGIMAKIEGRSIADCGLPWRRIFCLQFWLGWGIGLVSLAALLAVPLATSALMGLAHYFNPGWTVLGLFTVGGSGLIACLLLRRTGDLWMPIGPHPAWNWGEAYFFGIPGSGQSGDGNLFPGAFHGRSLADGNDVRRGGGLA